MHERTASVIDTTRWLPNFFSVTALFSAPIDVETAIGRLPELWNLRVDARWEQFEEGAFGEGSPAGRILRFSVDDVVVMLTPYRSLQAEQGSQSTFHVAATAHARSPGEEGWWACGEPGGEAAPQDGPSPCGDI